jgi:hypothetical protein
MKLAFLSYNVEQNWAIVPKTQHDAMTDDCLSYNRELLKDGHVTDEGVALQSTQTAKSLRWQNGAVVVKDGPFAETKEQLGGICVLEARDMDHAINLLSKHPGLEHGASFEIRPINEDALRRQAASISALRPGEPPVDPQTIRFASLGYVNESGRHAITREQFDAMLAQCKEFDEERIMSGQWLSGIGLQGTQTAKTVRAKAGKVIVTDGPFAETKEQLGGVVVLAFADWNDAIATLSKNPALPFGVVIEIRAINEGTSERWRTQFEHIE